MNDSRLALDLCLEYRATHSYVAVATQLNTVHKQPTSDQNHKRGRTAEKRLTFDSPSGVS